MPSSIIYVLVSGESQDIPPTAKPGVLDELSSPYKWYPGFKIRGTPLFFVPGSKMQQNVMFFVLSSTVTQIAMVVCPELNNDSNCDVVFVLSSKMLQIVMVVLS